MKIRKSNFLAIEICFLLILSLGAGAETILSRKKINDQKNYSRLYVSADGSEDKISIFSIYFSSGNDSDLRFSPGGEYALEAKNLDGSVQFRNYGSLSNGMGKRSTWSLFPKAYAGGKSGGLELDLDVPKTAIYLDLYRSATGKWRLLQRLTIPDEIIRDAAKHMPGEAFKTDQKKFMKSLDRKLQKLHAAIVEKNLELANSVIAREIRPLISKETTENFSDHSEMRPGTIELLAILQLAIFRIEAAVLKSTAPKCMSVAELGMSNDDLSKVWGGTQAPIIGWWIKEKASQASRFRSGRPEDWSELKEIEDASGFHEIPEDESHRSFIVSFGYSKCMISETKSSVISWATWSAGRGRGLREEHAFTVVKHGESWKIAKIEKTPIGSVGL